MTKSIPQPVLDAIKKHLTDACKRALLGWERTDRNEDGLTGYFFGKLDSEGIKHVLVDRTDWTWNATFKQMRGRGPKSDESEVGADLIIQIEFDDGKTKRYKGLLVQSKMQDDYDAQRLLKQVKDMEGLSPGGSVVLVFGPSESFVVDSKDIIKRTGHVAQVPQDRRTKVCEYLVDQFLMCLKGVRGMFWDFRDDSLVVPEETAGVRRVKARLKNTFRIKVHRPVGRPLKKP